MSKRTDWAVEYVVCEHVEALGIDPPTEGLRHSGFRVCCEACYDAGFLFIEDIAMEERPDGLCVGSLPATA